MVRTRITLEKADCIGGRYGELVEETEMGFHV